MIGFLVGTLCLLGLLRVLRKGRGGRRRHCEGGCGFRGHGRRFGGDGEWDPRGPRDEGDREYGGPYRSGPGDHGAEENGRAHRHDEEASGWRDRGGFGGFGGKAVLWEAFRRLDTTPGQEKVIRAVVDDLRARRGVIRDEMKKARGDAARAMRGEQWDENALGEAIARIDGSVEATRKALVDAMAKTHEVLDEKQRGVLADLIENGGFRGFRGRRARG
jgi:Spy/CpxP family protein refolding chaperone